MKRVRHLYIKFLTHDGKGPQYGYKYPMPTKGKAGAWIPKKDRVSNPLACERGFHAVSDHTNMDYLLQWEDVRAFVVEYDEEPSRETSKVVGGNFRLLAEVTKTGLDHPKAKKFKKGQDTSSRAKRQEAVSELVGCFMARLHRDEFEPEDKGYALLLKVCMMSKTLTSGDPNVDSILEMLRAKKHPALSPEDALQLLDEVFSNTYLHEEDCIVSDFCEEDDESTDIPLQVFDQAIKDAEKLFLWVAPKP